MKSIRVHSYFDNHFLFYYYFSSQCFFTICLVIKWFANWSFASWMMVHVVVCFNFFLCGVYLIVLLCVLRVSMTTAALAGHSCVDWPIPDHAMAGALWTVLPTLVVLGFTSCQSMVEQNFLLPGRQSDHQEKDPCPRGACAAVQVPGKIFARGWKRMTNWRPRQRHAAMSSAPNGSRRALSLALWWKVRLLRLSPLFLTMWSMTSRVATSVSFGQILFLYAWS